MPVVVVVMESSVVVVSLEVEEDAVEIVCCSVAVVG